MSVSSQRGLGMQGTIHEPWHHTRVNQPSTPLQPPKTKTGHVWPAPRYEVYLSLGLPVPHCAAGGGSPTLAPGLWLKIWLAGTGAGIISRSVALSVAPLLPFMHGGVRVQRVLRTFLQPPCRCTASRALGGGLQRCAMILVILPGVFSRLA